MSNEPQRWRVCLSDIDMTKLMRNLLENNIAVSFREGALRLSPHGYNDQTDIDRLFDVIDTLER